MGLWTYMPQRKRDIYLQARDHVIISRIFGFKTNCGIALFGSVHTYCCLGYQETLGEE
jgi:hypothetical protein